MRKAFYGAGVLALALLLLLGTVVVRANPVPPPGYEPPIQPIIDPGPAKPYYTVQTLQGFAMDRDSLDNEPAVLIRMNYNGRETSYLFIGEELHRLTQVNSQWVQNGEVIRYSVDGLGDGLTLYSGDGFYSNAFGMLGNRMIVFQPNYYPVYAGRAEPMQGETVPINVTIPVRID